MSYIKFISSKNFLSVSAIGAATAFSLSKSRYVATCAPSVTVEPQIQSSLTNQVVLITGATAGIGEACAKRLAKHNVKLILLGRRSDRLELLKTELITTYPNLAVHTVALSVTDLVQISKLPEALPSEFAEVDILINNAGLALGVTSVENNNIFDAETVINTNVTGMIAVCSAFLPGMKRRNRGHLINMGSCAGHYAYSAGSVYNASKYAVHGFTEAARHDLCGTPLRVTHISPGLVRGTEFSIVRLKDDEKAKAVYDNIESLTPDDVADNVEYALTRPSHVQIAEIIVYCTNQSGPKDIARLGKSMGAAVGNSSNNN